jgi:hypothetical protein
MNERWKKLAEQAIDSIPDDKSIEHGLHLYQKKFAELIVKECMDLALSEQKRYAEFTHRNMSECAVTMSNFRLVMKDHFGVEE